MINFTFKEDICALYDIEVRMIKTDGKAPVQMFYKPGEFNEEYRPF